MNLINSFRSGSSWAGGAAAVAVSMALTASYGVIPALVVASSYGLYKTGSACCMRKQPGTISYVSVVDYPKIEKITNAWLSVLNDKEMQAIKNNECLPLELEDSKNVIGLISESLTKNKKLDPDDQNDIYVFEDDNQEIRGIMTVLPKPEYVPEAELSGNYLYVDYLATDPSKILNRIASNSKEKNLRVGTRMIEKAMEIAKFNGLNGIILVDSGKSTSFYEKNGFKHFKEHSLYMYKLVSDS